MSQSGCIFLALVAVIGSLMGYTLSKRRFHTIVVYGILGVIGALVGGWIAMTFGFADMTSAVIIASQPFPAFWGIIGSFALSTITGIIGRTTNDTTYSKENYT